MKIAANTATTTYILPELRSSAAISTPVDSWANTEIEAKSEK